MSRFKIGDRVRLVNELSGVGNAIPAGSTGEVVRLWKDYAFGNIHPAVVWDDPADRAKAKRWMGRSEGDGWYDHHFELIQPIPPLPPPQPKLTKRIVHYIYSNGTTVTTERTYV
ncbi:MAG: hypothetical protein M0P95_17900 [Sulfuritalea sp.]|jgi:hypothetical protein|nr:hypothetical protein [Sulfuritalea sp.]